MSYSKGGFGATLGLLTTGPNAPILEMEKEKLRARVNAAYGYNAIARIRITQTAATGFADGQVQFTPAPARAAVTTKPPAVRAKAAEVADPIEDDGLRRALALLGENILNKTHR